MINVEGKKNINEKLQASVYENIELYNDISEMLAIALNKIHRVSYSQRFWEILLGSYITAVIYDKDKLEKENTSLKVRTFLYTNALQVNSKAIIFNRIRYLTKIVKSKNSVVGLANLLKGNQNVAMGFHYPEAIIPEMDIYLKSVYPFFKNKKYDSQLRNISIDKNEKYSDIFVENMIKFIPKVYVEHFTNILDEIPVFESESKIFHISFFQSILDNFIIAKYIENGSKLYYYQHGGFFGEYEYHKAHRIQGRIADKFMTWGWKKNENDEPSKAYRLEKFRKQLEPNQKNEYDLLMVYPIIFNRNKNLVEWESKLFFKNLKYSKYPKICARPRPIGRFNRKSTLKFIAKDVSKIDNGFSKIYNLIERSKLVIILSYPSTTLLECLYVNKPVIGLLKNDQPSNIVRPYYNFFLEKGMLHTNMQSMVNHLNETDIMEWWEGLIQHPMYLKFKEEFLKKV